MRKIFLSILLYVLLCNISAKSEINTVHVLRFCLSDEITMFAIDVDEINSMRLCPVDDIPSTSSDIEVINYYLTQTMDKEVMNRFITKYKVEGRAEAIVRIPHMAAVENTEFGWWMSTRCVGDKWLAIYGSKVKTGTFDSVWVYEYRLELDATCMTITMTGRAQVSTDVVDRNTIETTLIPLSGSNLSASIYDADGSKVVLLQLEDFDNENEAVSMAVWLDERFLSEVTGTKFQQGERIVACGLDETEYLNLLHGATISVSD